MRKEDLMAAQLKDGGRYPAVQKLDKAQFSRFAAACEAAPKPSASLKGMLEKVGGRKADCR
jgi:hypothetical protein